MRGAAVSPALESPMEKPEIDPIAMQAGFGFAAWLVVVGLLNELAELISLETSKSERLSSESVRVKLT
jgi:hypothetical protein